MLLDVITLLACLGFPRIQGTDIPICALLIFVYWKRILHGLLIPYGQAVFGLMGLLLIFGFAVWYSHDKSQVNDLFFLLTIIIKMALSAIVGMIIAPIIYHRCQAFLIWLIIQSCIIFFSIVSESFFNLLVLFGGLSGQAVYENLFGIRAMGFGIVHVYGALTVISAGALYVSVKKSGHISICIAILTEIVGLLVSRTGLVLLGLQLWIQSRLYFVIIVGALLLLSTIIGTLEIESGVIANLFEAGINFLHYGEIRTVSTDASIQMIIFPQDVHASFLGFGRFFEEGSFFFMNTDVGFSRVTLFGGYPLLFLFIISNLYPLFVTWKKNAELRGMAYFLAASFLLVNLKGLADIGIIGYAVMFASLIGRSKSRLH
jgi:hypothetical protein